MQSTVIIVNFNTAAATVECIRAIRAADPGVQIVVVDNASQDASVPALQTAFAGSVTVIANPTNIGFGAACNQGARAAAGEVLFFINTDVIVNCDVFSGLQSLLRSDADIGVAAPLLVLADGRPQPYAFGREPGLLRLFIDRLKRKADIALPERGLIETDWVSGAAFAIERALFLELSGFDERFFMYFEDVDLCRRCRTTGRKVVVDTTLSAVHEGGKSFHSQPGEQKRIYYESQDRYFSKYHSRLTGLFLVLLRSIFT